MPAATLTDEQKAQVAQWAAEGADLNQIQDRLKTEMGITLTFMDTRFLISDLGITLRQEKEETEPEARDEDDEGLGEQFQEALDDPSGSDSGSSVSVTLDEIALPGAMASGKVTFSDGVKAAWQIDAMGRLGLTGVERSYQPPEADMMQFQVELQRALRRSGY